MNVEISKIVFREDLYPRIEKNPITVQQYAENIETLPPIEINQHNELIDGWHRWTAHKKVGEHNIKATVTKTESDTHLLELAIERNATHGLQLNQEDKRNMARRIYHITSEKERDDKKKYLAKILSVSERTVRDWLSRIDKDSKVERDKRIFDLWLACHTGKEISDLEGVDEKTVGNVVSGISEDLPKIQKLSSEHATDFDPPIYNIWKQQEKTPGKTHFGNSEIRWLDNLLYLYTKPFDVVVDPFGGSGSTVDICKKRLRRYWVSDRKIEPELEGKMRQHDISEGLPPLSRWKDVKLVYLDPPYWKQAEGRYSKDKEDLSNMTLEKFNETLSVAINSFSKKLSDSHIALIIQPTQWNAPEHKFTDHIGDMLRLVKLPVEMRFSAPYESQQYNAQMVEWAKNNKKCLVLTREIIIWKVS